MFYSDPRIVYANNDYYNFLMHNALINRHRYGLNLHVF